jgi:serine protease Do
MEVFVMKEEDFYKNFGSENVKANHFKKSFLVPFFSGILGTVLVVAIVFGIPNIKNKILNTGSSTNSKETSATVNNDNSNSGTVNEVSLSNYSDTAIYTANKVLPSIVGITVEYTVTSNLRPNLSQNATAEGSGIIISSDGYILTNNHIINSTDDSSYYEVSKAAKVYVYLYNDSTAYEAKIIGTDSETDLAVIKIDKTDLTAAELGDSNSVKVGEFVIAIGNPLGMQSSVTSGIISAVNRTVTDSDGKNYVLLQTDAAINAGNSGGALVDADGKVIGINTLKLSGSGIEGMGFAIPINDTLDVYKQLIENGKVLRPYIGISGIDVTEALATQYKLPVGIYVKSIEDSSAATLSDLKVGDVITKIDGNDVATMNSLKAYIKQKNIGDKVTLDVFRDNKTITITVTLGEQP